MNFIVVGLNGERQDPVTAHYNLGNGMRTYNPALMRFEAPDSMSPFGPGGLHSYAYCSEDPVNRADPSGHFSISGVIGICVGVLGILFTPVTGGVSLAAMVSVGSVVAGVASTALSITSEAVNDPHTATVLGWTGIALGLLSGVCIAAVGKLTSEAQSAVGQAVRLFRNANRVVAGIEMRAMGGMADAAVQESHSMNRILVAGSETSTTGHVMAENAFEPNITSLSRQTSAATVSEDVNQLKRNIPALKGYRAAGTGSSRLTEEQRLMLNLQVRKTRLKNLWNEGLLNDSEYRRAKQTIQEINLNTKRAYQEIDIAFSFLDDIHSPSYAE